MPIATPHRSSHIHTAFSMSLSRCVCYQDAYTTTAVSRRGLRMNFCCSFNPFSLVKSQRGSHPDTGGSSSTVPLVNFVALNLPSFKNYSKSPRERVRDVTAIRCHPPSLTERINLRIPSIFETIDLSTLSGMIMLCGGNNGVLFTVEVSRSHLHLSRLLPPHLSTLGNGNYDLLSHDPSRNPSAP
jgi:hypothetical protein